MPAFQPGAFQAAPAFQIGFNDIIDTDILQKPIDAVLAGKQPIKDRYREWDIRPMNMRGRTRVTRGGVQNIGGEKPSFTVTTTKKGYD